ncbi:uncharacterized protein GIQ15_06193 [Arthroderma uncinatum]|uniref:uncharacterized protein n=1 Tax=Arthroderma uncinatum TaxID=74035 RepID=UPI00144ACA2B|nr:uncharacterized protein GIQ15_06193 [Arthroderma uncinatum]KAF3480846.1 hypothetical protein GIQ15_06193 [Arthroderma uncinatum]
MSFNDTQQRGESAGYYNPGDLSLDQDQAIKQARRHGNGREDDDNDISIFSQAMSFLGDHKEKLGREDIDEEKVVNNHQKLYGDADDRGQKHGAESLGSGAAMQALKMFMDDSGKQDHNQNQNQNQGQQSQGGGDQNKLIGIAMAQAGKLWEQKNQEGRVDTDKQTAVNMAAQYALKMYLKGQMGGGGGGLGGLGGLALISGALGGGGGGNQQQSGLAAIAGALGGSGGQQQQQQQQGGAANLLGMASKFL